MQLKRVEAVGAEQYRAEYGLGEGAPVASGPGWVLTYLKMSDLKDTSTANSQT